MILACRNETRGTAAADDINVSIRAGVAANEANGEVVEGEVKDVGATQGHAAFMKLDLASFASIRAFCAAFEALPGSPALNILVNNACTVSDKFQQTEDGYELMYGVGQIGHFLLTSLLMPKLEAGSVDDSSGHTPFTSRIVILTSTVTVISSKDGVLNMPFKSASKYSMMSAYAETKLANALFAQELARRSDARGGKVRALAVHPGVIETDLSHNMMPKFFFKLVAITKKNTKQGAATSTLAAAHPYIDSLPNGQYFEDCTPKKSSNLVYSKRLAKRVWDNCKAICGIAPYPDTDENAQLDHVAAPSNPDTPDPTDEMVTSD